MSTLTYFEEEHTIISSPCNLWNILCQENTQVSLTALNEGVRDHINVANNLITPSNSQSTAVEDVSDQDISEKTSDSEETRSIADSCSSVSTNNDKVSVPTIEDLLVARSHIQKANCTIDEDETARKISRILQQYSPAPRNPTKQQLHRSLIEKSIWSCVHQKKPLHLILPAFPFKSPNTIDKVLGRLPDMGEELALATLDGLCTQINEVYPGTTLSIISDGLVYNDILGVSDEDVWNYGSQLRSLAKSSSQYISFVRLSKLVSDECPEPTTLEEYLAKASWYREEIVNQHLPKDFDVNWEIKHQINSLLTYRGYLKFLKTDLKHDPTRQGLGSNQVKRMNEAVAKRMITRGAAFALAIQNAFPTSIRLSIHESESQCKLPIALFSGGESYTTPWHCTSALELDGSWKHAHNAVFAADPSYELVHRNERPSYYRKRSDLYDWNSCMVTPVHPCGLLISPREPHAELSMGVIDMRKARKLAELNSPIIFRGFKNTTNRELFLQKAREMGPVMPWKFGEVLVVKDAGSESAGLNNVLSAEPMPMHFDGMFKTIKVKDDAGNDRLVPKPPKFQWFTVATPSPKDCGHTLIASSRLLFSHLPQEYKFETLKKMTWTVTTTAFNNSAISNLQLVIPHPELSTPCLRYHEPWPSTKTRFDPTHVSIDGLEAEESTKVTGIIDELLYDRRICYYHEWVEGDLVLSDNISMMHTRTSFTPGAPRELWRIHID